MTEGFVVWITGLPCSGKTTLANVLASLLRHRGLPVDVLDGDELRKSLSADLGFSSQDRREQVRRVTFVSKLLMRNGINVIVPIISPYRDSRDAARTELSRFVEVYADCPVEVCMRRDEKGHYARAIKGEIKNFTGISDPYEFPENPEVSLKTDSSPVEECVRQIWEALRRQGYLVSVDQGETDAFGPSARGGPTALGDLSDGE